MEDKFLIDAGTKIAANRPSLLAHLILRAVSSLKDEVRDEIFSAARGRGGMMDVRIVIEGKEFAFPEFDEELKKAFEHEKMKEVKFFIDSNMQKMTETLHWCDGKGWL